MPYQPRKDKKEIANNHKKIKWQEIKCNQLKFIIATQVAGASNLNAVGFVICVSVLFAFAVVLICLSVNVPCVFVIVFDAV